MHHHHHGHHGFGHHHHGHHGFGNHHGFGHHRGFGHRHHGMGGGGLLAAGAVGVIAGAAVASTVARPSTQYGGGYGTGVYAPAPAMFAPATPVYSQQVVPQQNAPPLLGISSVRLPQEAIVEIGGVHYFTVEVMPDNGSPAWRVQRRYNQFNDLADRLGGSSRNMLTAPFARKHLTGCEGSKLHRRRDLLQNWLDECVRRSNSYDHAYWRVPLRQFLEVPMPAAPATALPGALPNLAQVGIPSTPLSSASPSASRGFTGISGYPAAAPSTPVSAAAAPASFPPLPAPLPPPSQAPPAEVAGPAQGEGYAMEIEVPAGVEAGQHISVAVPTGEQLLVKMPDNTVPGQSLRLWYEAGTLQPLM